MKRPILAWSAAFLLFSVGAAAMLASSTSPRDPSKLTPAERELISLKIREGDLLAQKGDLSGARAAWSEARAMGSGLALAHQLLGDSYAKHKLHAEADREYEAAERYSTDMIRPLVCAKRARNLRAMGRSRKALNALLDLHNPSLASEIADSIVSLEFAAVVRERAERSPWLWYPVHSAYAKLGESRESATALGRYVIAIAPWDRLLVDRAIELLRSEKLTDHAVAVCRAHAKAVPYDPSIHMSLGDLLADAGRTDEAAVAYTSPIDLRPIDADAHGRTGVALHKIGRTEEAIRQLEIAAKLNPSWNDELLRHRTNIAREPGVALGIAIDTSGSMEQHLPLAKRGALELVRRFGAHPIIVAEIKGGVAPYRPIVIHKIANLAADGSSPIGPGLLAAKLDLDATRRSRMHLVIFTDGESDEGIGPAEALHAIMQLPPEHRPVVHAIVFGAAPENWATLGAHVASVTNEQELDRAVAAITPD
ncbi:MAG: tetratricopeptide repeat protein [Planctomycetes bacterium]|nr:tetratricopeptide repeat protein [Planctomycetota bacterium]